MWDEAFCRREKMPFCMQILSGEDACAPMGQERIIPGSRDNAPREIAQLDIAHLDIEPHDIEPRDLLNDQ